MMKAGFIIGYGYKCNRELHLLKHAALIEVINFVEISLKIYNQVVLKVPKKRVSSYPNLGDDEKLHINTKNEQCKRALKTASFLILIQTHPTKEIKKMF